jgi:predicted aspartyl protease
VVEINRALIEGLVDTDVSILVMATSVVRELDIMHLVSSHETYKIASRTITQASGRITNVLVTIDKVVCQLIFLVVNIDSYDLLFKVGLSYEDWNGHRC